MNYKKNRKPESSKDSTVEEEESSTPSNTRRNSRSNAKSSSRRNAENAKYEDGKQKRGRNDAAWYAQTPQLLADSASLSYSWPVGNRMRVDDPSKLYSFDESSSKRIITCDGLYNQAISGVMGLEITPTIGRSSDQNSAVNTAARNIYSFVRHANSGHANYESADLMMYLLAMDNLYSSLMYLQRTYGLLQLYSTVNRYYPLALINTCRLDAADLLENLADFRYFINNIAIKIGSLCVPNTMPYMARHIQLYSSVYLDDDQAKSQSYIFFPRGFYEYNELTGGAGQLDFIEWSNEDSPKLKFKDIVSKMNSMINKVLASEDMNIMSGDILKAYGYDKIVKISTIPEDFLIVPEYNVEMLTQIANLEAVHSADIEDWTITQDPSIAGGGAILQPLRFTKKSQVLDLNDRFINFKWSDITPEHTMVASRLMAMPYQDALDQNFYLECGSEVCTGMVINTFVWSDDTTVVEDRLWMYSDRLIDARLTSTSAAGLLEATRFCMKVAHRLSQFDYHPQIQYGIFVGVDDIGVSAGDYMFGSLYELANYSTVSIQTLRKMHETALLSEFNVVSAAFVGNSRF